MNRENAAPPCLHNAKGALVAHADEGPQTGLHHHRFLEAGKVLHVLQDKELRPRIIWLQLTPDS